MATMVSNYKLNAILNNVPAEGWEKVGKGYYLEISAELLCSLVGLNHIGFLDVYLREASEGTSLLYRISKYYVVELFIK